ncbi:MAG: mannose-6-phosphate isomerase, class I [Planctomycetota bacterium]
MREILLLKNPIQEYEWGSRKAIAELLGEPAPSPRPQAELWMGSHPRAPSSVRISGRWERLPDLIARAPEEILGRRVAERFGARLPFLFKVLAAAKPLSLQAHPSAAQAREGFLREEQAGIPLNARERCYRDDAHKPETLCALSPFSALSGFRRIPEILGNLRDLAIEELSAEVAAFERSPDAAGLRRFFAGLLTLPDDRRKAVVRAAVRAAEASAEDKPEHRWILRLHEEHPDDAGVLSPLLLNCIRLEPTEALFLPAGELHTYLEGVAVEIMANSDNVLRGGLTKKHVDVPELLRVLSFRDGPVEILAPEERGPELRYPARAEEFQLSAVRVRPGSTYAGPPERNVEVWIAAEGRVLVESASGGEALDVPRGASFLVPAALPGYAVRGDGLLYRATVP